MVPMAPMAPGTWAPKPLAPFQEACHELLICVQVPRSHLIVIIKAGHRLSNDDHLISLVSSPTLVRPLAAPCVCVKCRSVDYNVTCTLPVAIVIIIVNLNYEYIVIPFISSDH